MYDSSSFILSLSLSLIDEIIFTRIYLSRLIFLFLIERV